MTALMTTLKAAWGERSAREQVLLAGLVALLAITLVWFAILAPAFAWRDGAARAYDSAVADYESLLDGLALHATLSAGLGGEGSAEPLRTLVGASAGERSLSISRMQPLEDGGLGVWFDAAPADVLMSWLADLSSQDGVLVERVSLDREGDGVVRAQLLLRRPGGPT